MQTKKAIQMTTTTIRVSTDTRDMLQTLARTTGISMQDILVAALEQYRRQQILTMTNAAYAALYADASLSKIVEEERQEWDQTIGDGLEDD
jgi:predicted transcriptional regulator